ncbi:RNA helicase [Nonlabens ponticola]|uniref:RNA helicase n=1 Tax=Nonlabens ponticola TaxID=2496866 RepID=A0A3S9MYE9_9FLAO|nr:RNA helicase [Nonlabens ponticola]AZQ44275.1 RNA helicase [Nonlabens ponticola]
MPEKKEAVKKEVLKKQQKKCGIIMPIASHPEYSKEHWKEVLSILVDTVKQTEFEPRLVSDDVAIGLIHERIVNNIYNDEIVICDVSSKNPNVMFELGLRLAFDKPTIIIKDEKTGYSFDTGVIEHLNYPSSLRFNKIVEFKSELVKRINATYDKAKSEANYSPFLKSFGKTIVPAKINQTEIAESKYILSKLDNLSKELMLMRLEQNGINEEVVQREISPLTRRMRTRKLVYEFLDKNSHLTYEDIKNGFVDIISEEVSNQSNFIPRKRDIILYIEKYFEIKSKEDK